MLNKNRLLMLLAMTLIAAIAATACGTDNGDDGVAAASSPASSSSQVGTEATPVAAGGIDPDCVQQVLGRSVTGFADITDAERERVFAQCSPGGPGGPVAGQPGFGPGSGAFRGAGFDPQCVEDTLGETVDNFADLTAEQRTALFEACGGDVPFNPANGGTFTVRGFDDQCVDDTLGYVPESLADLSDEDRATVADACGGGFPDGVQPGQFGRTGGGFGALFDDACVQDALGHAVDDLTQLTQEERQSLFEACAPEGFSGGPGGLGGQFGRPGQTLPTN